MGHTDGSARRAAAAQASTDAQNRLLADQRLRDALAAEGFAGPHYEEFERNMIAYALPVFDAWMKSAFIFEKLASYGIGLERTEAQVRALMTDKDERAGIAHEVVAKALPRFREQELVTGRWNAAGGASLNTYFVEGAVQSEFPNKFGTWQTDFCRRVGEPCNDEVIDAMRSKPDGTVTAGPEQIVMSKDGCATILEGMNPRMARIFQYRADGYSYAEIAELEGSTPAAITEAVGRVRRRLRDQREQRRRREERAARASLNDEGRGGDAR